MQRLRPCRAVVVASIVVMGAASQWLLGTEAAAQTAAAGSMPVFEVDAGWPKVPAKWKLGDESSFAVDAKDNVWLLQPSADPQAARSRDGGAARHGLRYGGQLHQGLGRSGQRL